MLQAVKSATWKVIAASMVAGQVLSPVLMSAHGRPPFAPEQLGFLVVAGLVLGGWLLFSAWTWSRVGQMRDSGGRHVYNWGVLAWGVPVAVTVAVTNAVDEVGGIQNALSWSFAVALLTSALIHFPLVLWVGWLFGWAMTAALGKPSRSS